MRGAKERRRSCSAEFGEAVLWKRKRKGNHLGKLTCMWSEGIYLGVKASSGEFMIGTARGVWTTRTVRRRPIEDRWSPASAKLVGGVPWFEKREDLEESDEETELVFRPMTAEEREEEDRLYAEPEVRSFPISRRDLETYGYTSTFWLPIISRRRTCARTY